MNYKIVMKIRKIRKDKGITQKQLAEMANISQSGLSEIERGTKDPRLSTLIFIAQALDVAVGDLFEKISL